MDLLLRLGSRPGYGDTTATEPISMAFRKIRHIIGRLAAYTCAVKELYEDSPRVQDMLDMFEVSAVPRPASAPKVMADGHTSLQGVLKRMTRSDDARYPILLEYLTDLDSQTGLEKQLLAYFEAHTNSVCVHAEVQQLNHFHDSRLKFVDDDPYIAISKPACFCCKLYFRYHPAGYVEPDSHEKVYCNWSPVLLAYGYRDPGWPQQRRYLGEVVRCIGNEVVAEIDQRREVSHSSDQQDSLTGLTGGFNTIEDVSSSSDSEYMADEYLSSDSGIEEGSDSDGGVAI